MWTLFIIMFENSIIQMTTGKLVAATVLPNSILLISGIIIWRYWRHQQVQLQAETEELNDEVRLIKEQLVEIQLSKNKVSDNNKNQPVVASSSSRHKGTSKEGTDQKNIGLFEFLIEDNIQLRQKV